MFKKLCLLCFFILLVSCGVRLPNELKAPKKEFRGVWIATVANIDWPLNPKESIAKKKQDYLKILEFYKALNFNAVIIQVRTAGDAFYPSAYAPWSRFLTGKEGEAAKAYNHLLHWMIEETHKRGFEFHAWLNPYRATFDLNTSILAETHDYNQHPEWMVKYGKKYYYNPGIPEVQQHLANIITEIVENYDIDAIHFDDYFYPYSIKDEVFNDQKTFETYAKFNISLEDWRRENINKLIKRTYDIIKAKKPWVQFGVSPFGVWRNKSKDPLGSPTNAGQTTYDDLYADVLTWIKNHWIDYIAPQLYWSLHYAPASHSKLINWWANNHQKTKLYIGNGAYKVRNNFDKAWDKKNELPKQLKLARQTPQVSGNAFFSAKSLYAKNTDLAQYLKKKIYKYPALSSLKTGNKTNLIAPEITKITTMGNRMVLTLKSVPENTPCAVIYKCKSKRKMDISTGKSIWKKIYFNNTAQIDLAKKMLSPNKLYAITFINGFNQESDPFFFTFKKAKDGSLYIKKYDKKL